MDTRSFSTSVGVSLPSSLLLWHRRFPPHRPSWGVERSDVTCLLPKWSSSYEHYNPAIQIMLDDSYPCLSDGSRSAGRLPTTACTAIGPAARESAVIEPAADDPTKCGHLVADHRAFAPSSRPYAIIHACSC